MPRASFDELLALHGVYASIAAFRWARLASTKGVPIFDHDVRATLEKRKENKNTPSEELITVLHSQTSALTGGLSRVTTERIALQIAMAAAPVDRTYEFRLSAPL